LFTSGAAQQITAIPRRRGRNGAEGGWQGASVGAVRDKTQLGFVLARNRAQTERPPEPQGGVHPTKAQWKNGAEQPN